MATPYDIIGSLRGMRRCVLHFSAFHSTGGAEDVGMSIACVMKNGSMHRPAPTRIPRTRKKQTKTRVSCSETEIKLDSIQLEAFLVELSA